jgi:hypothetical protein
MAGGAVRPALAPELAGADMQAATGDTVASATASASAGAEPGRRRRGRAQSLGCATEAENIKVSWPSVCPEYAGGFVFA